MRQLLKLFIGILLISSGKLSAQQDPMFTKYFFVGLAANPAYAGSQDHMSLRALHRSQWIGVDGAPRTQVLTAHTPLKNERVGLGLSILNDQIGVTGTTMFNVAYAYRIPTGKTGKLALGLQAGLINARADWARLNFKDPQGGDIAFNQGNPNMISPNFGAGVYYYTKHFFAGVGAPHIINTQLRKNINNSNNFAQTYRHYYANIGGAIPLSGDALIFKPMMSMRNIGLFGLDDQALKNARMRVGAPTGLDFDLSLLFDQKLWIGAAYRTAIEAFDKTSSWDSADIWAAYNFANGMRLGAAYDFPLTKIQTVSPGSFELMLGYDFDYKSKRVVTPRYF
jgi:type IX secretion system PorP/SprF family membrane protein